MLGGRVNIVYIGEEKAYVSVIFVNLKENFLYRINTYQDSKPGQHPTKKTVSSLGVISTYILRIFKGSKYGLYNSVCKDCYKINHPNQLTQ